MRYTIVLPVRNGGEYIKLCLASIRAQTFTDFNLIVLDNCSTDGTKEWVESLNDQRIVLLTAKEPLNIEESWARITTIKKNEFITIIGHDDILYPNFLDTIDKLISQKPSASLYLTHFDLIDAQGKLIRHCKPMQTTYRGDTLVKAILANSIDVMGTGYVMRARDYDQLGGIPVKYPSLLFADYELWIKLASISFEAVSAANCFAFRIHQSTTGSSKDKVLRDALDKWIDYLVELKHHNEKMKIVIDEYGSDFLRFQCKGLSHRLLRTNIQERDGMTVERMIAQTKLWAKKIGLEKRYHPEELFSIRIAKIIDRSRILRKIFLFVKKIYPKPIMKK